MPNPPEPTLREALLAAAALAVVVRDENPDYPLSEIAYIWGSATPEQREALDRVESYLDASPEAVLGPKDDLL